MTTITPNYLHRTNFKQISDQFINEIMDNYIDNDLEYEYILNKDEKLTTK